MTSPLGGRDQGYSSAPIHEAEHRDPVGARMGMWLFLYGELILFGGLFLLYAMYLTKFRPDFLAHSRDLSLPSGATNTVILLTSSMTMAMSISAIRKGRSRASRNLLCLTILLALCFLVIKYFEWRHKFHLGIYPNAPELAKLGRGATIFYGLYYVMTGLHGLHVLVGVGVLVVMTILISLGRIDERRFAALENSGLYWHLVDLIWIYLFPLFYLIR